MSQNERQKISDASHIRECFTAVSHPVRIPQFEIDAIYRFNSSLRTIADAEEFADAMQEEETN